MKPTARLDKRSRSTTPGRKRGLSSLRGTGEAWIYLDLDAAWEAIDSIGQDPDDYFNDAGVLNEELAEFIRDILNDNGFNVSIEERNADNQFNSLYSIAVVDGDISQADVEALLSDARSFMGDNASGIVYAPLSSDNSNVEGVQKLIENIKTKGSFPNTEGIRLAPFRTRMREVPTVHFKSVTGSNGNGGDNGDGSNGNGGSTTPTGTFRVTGTSNGSLIADVTGEPSSAFRQKGGEVRVTVFPSDFEIDPIEDPIDDPIGDPIDDPILEPALRGLGRMARTKPTMRLPSKRGRRARRRGGLGQTQVEFFTLTVPAGSYTTRPDGKVEIGVQESIPQSIRSATQSGHTVTMVVLSTGSGEDNGNGGSGDGGNGDNGGGNGNGGNGNGNGGGNGGEDGGGSNGGGGTVVGGGRQPTGQRAGIVPGVSNATLVIGAAGIVSLAVVAASN